MAMQETQIRLYGDRRPIALERVLAQPVTALLVYGITNPFGPTLTAVVVLGELEPGGRLPVVELMLNPFSQEVVMIGELALGDEWRPSAVIRGLFGPPAGGCPTLLLPSVHLEDDRAVPVYAEFLRRFQNGCDVLEHVRRHLGNPWDRVSAEMDEGYASLVESPAGSAAQDRNEALNEDQARELAGLLLSERHTRPEVEAFLYAWDGAVKFLREQGATAIADAAMSLETFQRIFSHITESCRVPDLGDSVSENPFTLLREAAENAIKQGYMVRDKTKALEALAVITDQLSELFGPPDQYSELSELMDTAKRAVQAEDWEGAKVPLFALLVSFRRVETAMEDNT